MSWDAKTKGFTLIEQLLAMTASAILILIAGVTLESTVRSIKQQRDFTALQADMRVAVSVLDNLARGARNSDINSPSTGMTSTIFRVSLSNSIYRANSSLVPVIAGTNLVYTRGSATNILNNGGVRNFSVRSINNGISYTLILSVPNATNDTIQVDGRAYFRNY